MYILYYALNTQHVERLKEPGQSVIDHDMLTPSSSPQPFSFSLFPSLCFQHALCLSYAVHKNSL